MNSIDIFVQNYFSLIRTPHLTEFMYLLSDLFNPSVSLAIILVFVAFLIYLVRSWRYSVLFISTLSVGWFFVYLLKYFFDVSRPLGGVVEAFGQSFPSGHTTTATIFFVMLVYIFDNYLKTFQRTVFNTLCITSVFLVSFSRVYLGVHWVSDVVGGLILGAVVCYVFIVIFNRSKNSPSLTSMLE